MIRILLVDDESSVRQIIATQINMDFHYRVIAQAQDGNEAIEKLKENEFDIVLTDISMPNCDGLRLAEFIRENYHELSVVIMSGYNNFEYAQKALKFGVSEYLLKPFVPSDLFECLEKLRAKIELSLFSRINSAKVRSNFFASIKNNELSSNQIKENIKLLELDMYDYNYVLCLSRFPDNDSTRDREEFIISCIRKNLIDGIRMESYFDGNNLMLLFSLNLSLYHFKSHMEKLFSTADAEAMAQLGTSVCFAMSALHQSIRDLDAMTKEASLSWFLRFDEDKNYSFFFEQDKTKAEDNSKILSCRDKVLRAVKFNLNIKEELFSFFIEASEFGLSNYNETCSILIDLITRIKQLWQEEDNEAFFSSIYASFFNKSFDNLNLQATYNLLIEALEIRETKDRTSKKSRHELSIEEICRTVGENLGNVNFSVEDSFSNLNYSASYIRYIFQQEKGISIKEYLTKERMNLAMNLLKNTTLSIKEISEQSGFKNQRYFSSTFRNYTNLSPSEYRLRQ